ncbi:MAG: TIGR00269 family protein [Ignisphaera sp.]|nr:TIGR00269 family protein [Ignisphaera sp.]
MPKCDRCKVREAVVFQRHTGLRLCKECFMDDLRQRVLHQVRKYHMILPGDRVLVGVSGGKDSYVLLKILSEIHSSSKIIGVMIEEGIRGYNRSEIFNYMKNICKALNIDCILTSIKEELGYSVDDFMELQLKKFGRIEISACTYCGIARRRILNTYARRYGADKVATGHNLDDEVQTYIINILRGDIMRLLQLHPLSNVHSKLLVKRIKPLRAVYEYETAFAAYLDNFRFQESECPYIVQRPTLRARLREVLNELERVKPGIQLRFLQEIDMLLEPFVETQNRNNLTLPLCTRCGEPTAPGRNLCKFCELIDTVIGMTNIEA